ncbi:MAG: hypothetical protein OEW91_05505 [Acidimicrobiia bacterium]|nr:hypothetical protein [Acidimicrobiia bacterium]
MDNPGFALIFVAIVLIVVGSMLGRRRNQLAEEQGFKKSGMRRPGRDPLPAPDPMLEVTHPRPKVAEMHVVGESAQVTFDVPFPEDGDEILADLLVQEAIEVVREKRHTLPMDMVHRVEVFTGRGAAKRQVGAHELDLPGSLPPKLDVPSMLNLSPFARDPLEAMENDELPSVPDIAAPASSDDLGPISAELRLPKALDMGLRAQGIDPATMGAVEMVTGLLRLFGYKVNPGPGFGMFIVEKGGTRTFMLGDAYRKGDHPEVAESTVDRFMADFSMSGCDRGMLVSEKFGPFEVYDRERREPRVSFITRERLQKLIDSLALS